MLRFQTLRFQMLRFTMLRSTMFRSRMLRSTMVRIWIDTILDSGYLDPRYLDSRCSEYGLTPSFISSNFPIFLYLGIQSHSKESEEEKKGLPRVGLALIEQGIQSNNLPLPWMLRPQTLRFQMLWSTMFKSRILKNMG
jgi:hypothetical protein